MHAIEPRINEQGGEDLSDGVQACVRVTDDHHAARVAGTHVAPRPAAAAVLTGACPRGLGAVKNAAQDYLVP